MSQNNIFTSLRSPLTKADDHGITDLLREVADRSSSLTDEERMEVDRMANRVEEQAARGTPIGKLKKKLADIANNLTDDGCDDNHSSRSSNTGPNTLNSTGSEPGPVNKWGKDLFQKMSNLPTIQSMLPVKDDQEQQKDQTTSKPTAREIFRNFSITGKKNPLKSPQQTASNGEKDQRPEIMKAFERSSQSGRDLLQKISKDFKNSLSPPQPQTPSSTAAQVSDSLKASGAMKFSGVRPVPKEK